MTYTVYDTTAKSPSLAERDMIWSVLLFGDHIQITSNFSAIFLMCGDFRQRPQKDKYQVYLFLKPMIDRTIGWKIFDDELKMISKLRNKKARTHLDQVNLNDKLAWLREIENQTVIYLTNNLAQFNYDQILPLTLQYVDMPEPEIKVVTRTETLDPDAESDVMEHFVKIISTAVSKEDNLFVFDDRIIPLITNHSISEYAGKHLQQWEKPDVFSETVFKMPLCYTLESEQIKLARNEMKPVFSGFHECIHRISSGEESMKTGMEKLRTLLPELQNKIESSTFVQNVHNRLTTVETVDVHLAFTTNKGILAMLKQLEMIDEEQVLQASDIIMSEASLDKLRPFVFIMHSSN